MQELDSAASAKAASHSIALSSEKRHAVKEQLERILVDPLFRHSKRCTDFLRYTVVRALDETTEAIKERSLGIELFGKQPDYDTNLDPIVRVSAAEVRKRLTQYYQVAGREQEIRVDFPRGSYVPEFAFPDDSAEAAAAANASSQTAHRRKMAQRALLIAGFAAPYIVLTIFLLRATRQTALDRFWGPVLGSGHSVLVCIPDMDYFALQAGPTDTRPWVQTVQQLPDSVRRRNVVFSDAIALSMATRVVGSKAGDFHVRRSEDATLDDLRQGPVILIGAVSNYWTKQLQAGRFSFVQDGALHYVADRQNPSFRDWAIDAAPAESNGPVDYGIVSRVLNPMTGTYVVTIAGLGDFGTQAAAECVADAQCLESAASLTPGDWKRGNIQLVVQTAVVRGNSGKAKVLASYIW